MTPVLRFRLGAIVVGLLIVASVVLVLAGVEWGLGVMLITGIAVIVAVACFRCPSCSSPYLYEGSVFWAHPTSFPSRCRKCGQRTDRPLQRD